MNNQKNNQKNNQMNNQSFNSEVVDIRIPLRRTISIPSKSGVADIRIPLRRTISIPSNSFVYDSRVSRLRDSASPTRDKFNLSQKDHNITASDIIDYINSKSILNTSVEITNKDENLFNLQITINNKVIFIIVDKNMEWEILKNRIDLHINKEITPYCPLCLTNPNLSSMTSSLQKNNKENIKENKIWIISCPNCVNNWCNQCYLKMIRKSILKKTDLTCSSCNFILDKTSFIDIN